MFPLAKSVFQTLTSSLDVCTLRSELLYTYTPLVYHIGGRSSIQTGMCTDSSLTRSESSLWTEL